MNAVINFLKVILILYGIVLVLLYFFQEKLIFFPQRLDSKHAFKFPQPFEEMNFRMADGKSLNAALFKADSPKGLIFYLHGNAGSLESWGPIAPVYTALDYDLLMLDYPGYGKSEGSISGESALHHYIQQVYDSMKTRYPEKNIIVLGYSIGSGFAAHLAANNHPRLLILQAPYYSLVHIVRSNYPYLPTFILRYRLETNKRLPRCSMPIVIFHGDQDEVINYDNSIRLRSLLKPGDTLITLKAQRHNGMIDNEDYREALKLLLR